MARNTIGVGLDGKHNAFAKSGEPTLAIHHDPNIARAHDVGIAPRFMKPAAKKVMHPVSIHRGMTERQQALKGMQHANATAPDANPASPLTKEPGRKTFAPVQAVPGQRSRTSQHDPAIGAAILASAVCNK
jgi:hypothetical protein